MVAESVIRRTVATVQNSIRLDWLRASGGGVVEVRRLGSTRDPPAVARGLRRVGWWRSVGWAALSPAGGLLLDFSRSRWDGQVEGWVSDDGG